jgi:protein TonB
MTIARAETSTNLQGPESQGTVSKGMFVALIGPNDAHRQVVAKALASAQGRKVHEFIDYPADLNDLARMMETRFDVVLVDVDTDESYALQIIAKLADMGPAVMAYSARTDQELLMNCMRAGAVDFLPLPTENGAAAETSSFSAPTPSVQQVTPKIAAKPPVVPAPAPPAARPTIKPIAAEPVRPVAAEPVREVRPSEERLAPPPPPSAAVENRQPAAEEHDDFAAWDKANLRPATPTPITKNPEQRPRPSLVPDRKKSESAPRVTPDVEETPAPAPSIERPPVTVELFRSATFEQDSEHNEAAEKQGAKFIKWILIGAGPVVLALVLLIVFTRSSGSNSATQTASAKETPAAPAEPKTAPGSQLIVNATGKTTPAAAIAKPSPANQDSSAPPPEEEQTARVSPDAMAQQLVAPSRIAGAIKKSTADEAPPAAPAPVSLDEGNPVAGSVFGSSAKVKVTPHVVPISAGVADGMIIRKTAPIYPRFAQEAHITGKVILKATITKQGNIEGVQVVSGPKMLAPAAADAVKTWKYRPYMLDGQPVSVETTVTVVFGDGR